MFHLLHIGEMGFLLLLVIVALDELCHRLHHLLLEMEDDDSLLGVVVLDLDLPEGKVNSSWIFQNYLCNLDLP